MLRGSYLDRNCLVALAARLALQAGYRAGRSKISPEQQAEGKGPNVVYIDLPTGQVSWLYPNKHQEWFAFLPPYNSSFDGHTVKEKRQRMLDFSKDGAE